MNRNQRITAAALSTAALCGLARPCAAQNYRELPIGGRTATMGGAATAAGNDSAMPYLNPAGMAGVPGDIFAVSATVYSYTHRSVQDFFYPNGTDPLLGYDLERETFALSSVGELPSSVMYFNHLSAPDAATHHHLGVSLVIPSARRVEVVASVAGDLDDVAGEAIETATISVDSTRYYLGPGYAVGFGDRVRLGASLYGVYTRYAFSDAVSSSYSLLGGSATFTYTGQRSQISETLSLAPVLGIQARIVSNLWLGAGFAAPSLPITGRLRFAGSSSDSRVDPTSGAPQSGSTSYTADAEAENNEPMRVNVGVAYDARDAFSFAADVSYYADRVTDITRGVQLYEERLSGELTRRFRRRIDSEVQYRQVIDFSLGAEIAASRMIAIRAGAFSDLAASPEIGTSLDQAGRMRLDRYGGSLGLGFTVGSFDTTAGVILARGTGHYGAADTWITGSVVPVRATETTGMLVLSGAVTVEEAKKTIRDTLPIDVPILPDWGDPNSAPPAPRLPAPLPPESKPPPPQLRTRPAPADATPVSPTPLDPTLPPTPPAPGTDPAPPPPTPPPPTPPPPPSGGDPP
jgi:hypothetical protein